jgi:protein-S-isoprenylcysteine O-methyltransferase Ste14
LNPEALPLVKKFDLFLRLPFAVPGLMAAFFAPAQTFDYWQAWVYLVIFVAFLFGITFYLFKNSPDLLARRLRKREREPAQILIVSLIAVVFIAVFVLPGFDRRVGWSDVPVPFVILADMVVIAGMLIIFFVFRENRYTSRTVEVDTGQTVISSGPYGIVRHPMYVGLILIIVATPLALGSYWAVLPGLLIVPLLAARILNEEHVLRRDLAGYTGYMAKIKYRLIPGVW